jgi:hypothetical protein
MADAAGSSDLAIGGIVGGVVSILALLGTGLRWLLGWSERRAQRKDASRSAKLQVWHDELEKKEAALNAEQDRRHSEVVRRLELMERKYDRLHTEHTAMRLAFQMVADGLRAIDPDNPALRQAERLLNAAFPLLPDVPGDMSEHLAAIDAAKGEA